MGKNYVSFYELAKEMALEDDKEYVNKYINVNTGEVYNGYEGDFRDYRKRKQKYFENILKIQGINPDIKYKQSGVYSIPVEEKEIIKLILKEYTKPYIKKVRKKGISTFEDVEEIVKKAESVIKENYSGIELAKQLSVLYGVLEYHSRKTGKEVYEKIIKLLHNAIDNIKIDKDKINPEKVMEDNKKRASCASIDELLGEIEDINSTTTRKYRFLNDYDAEFLIKYLEINLTFTIESWNKLVDVYSEIREANIEDISFEMIDLHDSDNTYEIYRSPLEIFKESLNELYDDTSRGYKLKELSPEELNVLGEIINTKNPNEE